MKKLCLVLLSFVVLNGSAQVPCSDDGFENLSLGTFSSSAWTAAAYSYNNTSGCNGSNTLTGTAPTSVQVSIVSSSSGTSGSSPFPGNKMVYLNSFYSTRIYMTKTINVTPSNFVYRYAYKALLGGGNSCWAGMMMFTFYDCSNHVISSLSKTIQPTYSNGTGTDQRYWKVAANYYSTDSTANWVIHSENLSAYVGSCVKVKVDIMPCVCGGYLSYAYFDDMCSDRFITVNSSNTTDVADQHFITNNSYLSCVSTTTLAGLPGFSSYSWQGPAGSGVSGSTLSAISTSVSGIYTLTASMGSFTATQQVSVTVTPPVSISGNSAICHGQSTNLFATVDPGILSYAWSNGASNASVSVSPPGSTVYSLTTVNTLGCAITSTFGVTVIPLPTAGIITPSATICAGESFNLGSTALMQNGLVWSNGNITPVITLTASAGVHTYSVLVTDPNGCQNSASASVTVSALPQIQFIGTTSICAGQPNSLQAQGNDIAGYLWNNGSSSSSPADIPAQSALYSVTVTGTDGCMNSSSQLVTVNALPQIQLSASESQVCKGESVQLDANGAAGLSYSWNTGASGSSLTDSPQNTYTYVVTATDANGCSSALNTVVQVYICTGLEKLAMNADGFAVFPNPAKDVLMIKGSRPCSLSLLSSTGQLIRTFALSSENNYTLLVSDLSKGVYFIKAGSAATKLVVD